MKKIVCASCGLVNLDKFVSYPHCAACGSRLPQVAPPRWRRVWKRRVKPLYWMLAVGGALSVLAVGIASLARETGAQGAQPLLVYSQIPRNAAPGQDVIARFALDSAQESSDATFERVTLRLGRETRALWQVTALQPAPTAIENQGSGRYYVWERLPRATALQLTLRPLQNKTSALPLHATLAAQNYAPFEVRAVVIMRGPVQKAPDVSR